MKTAALVLCTALVLSGCAGLRSVSSEVSSFGEWPAERRPGSYAFERLPSQQARAAETEALEASARQALAKAGFRPAEGSATPDVLVQVGASDARLIANPWDDPLWWRGGFGYWRYGPWVSPRWGMSLRYDVPRYERQVGVLIRDRASGKPLYETRASSEGNLPAEGQILNAMFEAALMDFPRLGMNPRRVVVQLEPKAANLGVATTRRRAPPATSPARVRSTGSKKRPASSVWPRRCTLPHALLLSKGQDRAFTPFLLRPMHEATSHFRSTGGHGHADLQAQGHDTNRMAGTRPSVFQPSA